MRPDEARALGQLAGDAAGGVATQARDVHAGVAARVFGALRPLGPAARGVQAVHDAVAGVAYAGARELTGAMLRGGGRALSLTRPDEAPALSDEPRARLAVGALNGAFGDLLARTQSPLATAFSLRHEGHELPVNRDGLAAVLPAASPRIAVFLHGLCETEDAWWLGTGRDGASRDDAYPERLACEHGYTAICARYNSGRHISHNGRDLAAALDALIGAWPVPVTEIALIGHSMGGLVARSACHYGRDSDWVRAVRAVVMLGTPHRGAPLELAANAATAALSLLPETRALARPLRARSVGVKDLGYGYVVDEDWEGHDPDRLWTDTGTEIPFLQSAEHYFVSATLHRDPEHAVSRAVGDLLVLHRSAWSQRAGERLRFSLDNYRHLGGLSHFTLLNHPAVYALLDEWLGRRALTAAV